MQRPPQDNFPAIHTVGQAPEWMTPITTHSRPRGSGMFGNGTNTQLHQVETSVRTQEVKRQVQQEFETKSQALPVNLEAEIAANRSQLPASSISAVQAWQREVDIRETLRARKTVELQQKNITANAFFGSDPRDKSFTDFVRKATTIDKLIWPGARSTQLWEQSYLAAHEAQLLSQSIALLHQQAMNAQSYLRAAQAEEHARNAAMAEAARVAAENARIAAEQQRQRDIADAARRQAEHNRAQEQARLAAVAEAQRLAAERARIATEQQRQKDLAEVARRQQEEHRAREQARLEGLANAERARIAAEQQRQRELDEIARKEQEEEEVRDQAEREELRKLYNELIENAAREKAKAQADALALKTALARAQVDAEAAAQFFAVEQARLTAEMEQRIEQIKSRLEAEQRRQEILNGAIRTATSVAQQQAQLATQKINQQRAAKSQAEADERDVEEPRQISEIHTVYPASGALAVSRPVFSFASSAVRLPPATTTSILNAMRSGLLTLTTAGTALIAPAVVGFAALLMPSRLGNGDRFTLSVPFAELSSETPETLREIADRQGTLDLPVGLGIRSFGPGAEVFVTTTDDFHVRSSVLVLNAAYDLLNDVYEAVLPDSPTDFLTWTPAHSPGNSSTASPITETDTPAYSGAAIIPVEGRLDINPILVEGWERFIIVFPDDSGIAPLYVVFSSPYEGAIQEGEHSTRKFNPEEIGLPIILSHWGSAIATPEGVFTVESHTLKFPKSAANEIMVDRLYKVLQGELEMTDTDKRFYTHEIREFERLKAMGYGDNEMPDKDSPVWNNVHAATLEDYQLRDDPALLYTPEALEADDLQQEREYQKLLKEMW
ncbi:S-type pyocin domain-containing protein [Pseudomonas sp. NPDC087804]|uniref:S-type pyocin domain-containing protein n=1 Tax=Pseudomonas sp. NPDC087804 TaxID=3364449 RepID=UPI003825D93F